MIGAQILMARASGLVIEGVDSLVNKQPGYPQGTISYDCSLEDARTPLQELSYATGLSAGTDSDKILLPGILIDAPCRCQPASFYPNLN